METTSESSQKQEFPDAFALFKPSWEAFKCNFETFVWQLLLPVALVVFAFFAWGLAIGINHPIAFGFAAVISVALACFGVVIYAALVMTQLASARQEVISFRQSLRKTYGFIWRLVGLFILCSIIIVVGFVLFIVPGIFAMQRLLLAPYFLVDQNIGIRQAIRQSWRAGKKFSSPIWGIVWITIGINIVSWVPVLGWIASIVLTIWYLNAPAIRYLEVKARTKHHSAPIKA